LTDANLDDAFFAADNIRMYVFHQCTFERMDALLLMGRVLLCHESGINFLTNIYEFEYINKLFYIVINSCTAS